MQLIAILLQVYKFTIQIIVSLKTSNTSIKINTAALMQPLKNFLCPRIETFNFFLTKSPITTCEH